MTDVILHYVAPVGTCCDVCGATTRLQRVDTWLLCRRCVTRLDDIQHGRVPRPRRPMRPERRAVERGYLRPHARLDDPAARAARDRNILAMAANGVPQVEIAARLGISQQLVSKIVRAHRRKAAPAPDRRRRRRRERAA